MNREHEYDLALTWTGNDGDGTRTYRGYRRDHTVVAEGRPELLGSSDPAFRGDPGRWSPEQLLVASLSQCHMLWYLHLASTEGIVVVDYQDAPTGTMTEHAAGDGLFREVLLRPRVVIAEGDKAVAEALHGRVGEYCFIARSVNFPVRHEATTIVQTAVAS
ncbi:OsmC family protein [Microbacterium sp.]|uniref:OsmC family protein n=1 Tax=Microbacterium sp. TaxID=51671 RepID=UPI002811D485|nr:OsmC family protein [Microbacterium sp.]